MMSSTKTFRQMMGRLALAAALALCVQGAAHAQSTWQSLARLVASGNKQPAPAKQEPARQNGLVTDPSLSVSHGYSGIKPNAELASAQVRSAINAIGDKLPSFTGKNVALGWEMDETTSTLAVNLFKDPEISKLLGTSPRFVYDPAGKSDPMIVPWVRRAAIAKELFGKADQFVAAGQFDRAVAVYRQILEMRDQRYIGIVQQKLAELDKAQQIDMTKMAAAEAQQIADEKVELPAWVHDNTTGVLFEKNSKARGGLCLVGEYMLHVGEPIPSYPEISVAAIGEKSVTYRFRNHEFKVELNNN